MISFSRSFLRRAAKIFLFTLAIIISAQIILSLLITFQKKKIIRTLSSEFGYRLELKGVSFGFIKGLHLKGLYIFYEHQPDAIISVKNAYLGIRIFPLLLARISARISIDNAKILEKKEAEGYSFQIIMSDIAKKIPQLSSPIPMVSVDTVTADIERAEFIYAANANSKDNLGIIHKNIRISVDKYAKVRLNSRMQLYYAMPKESRMAKFLNFYEIRQDLKVLLQGTLQAKDLNIDLLSLNTAADQFIGTGKIKDFTERNPYLDINFINSPVRLHNIAFLKKAFEADGNMSLSFRLTGPMDSTRFAASARLDDCNFQYRLSPKESFILRNTGGKIDFADNRIEAALSFLDANERPYRINAKIGLAQEPEIQLGLYLSKSFFSAQNIPLDKLEINFKGKTADALTGSLEIKALYAKKDSEFNIEANFQNIYFDYRDPRKQRFKADVALIKNNIYLSQKLVLNNLAATLIKNQDKIEITNIISACYGGKLEGAAKIDLQGKPRLTIGLKGTGLDVKKVMDDTHITDKLLSGNMGVQIYFDNRQDAFLKGKCHIKDGIVDLNVLASAVKFPSLNLSGFYIMDAFFICSKDLIKLKGVKLYSQDIRFNGFWDIDTTLKGALNMAVSSRLLKQSPSFRKLLSIADINKPYIDFKFLLGGIPRASRFMWSKGEFKEKLEQGLPGWIKRRIQNGLNKSIDEVSE